MTLRARLADSRFLGPLSLATLVTLSGSASAQSPAPAEAAPAASASAVAPPPTTPPSPSTATPTVAPSTAAPTSPSAEGTAPQATAAAAPAAAEATKPIPSYFRIDHDYLFGLQLWAGATYPITDKFGIATDIYIAENAPVGVADPATRAVLNVAQSWWGEFDIGPALTFGPLSVTPMVGVAFDWAAKRAVAINGPQLYTILNLDKFYFESWVWTILYSPFKKDGPNDFIHTRNWFLYKINSTIAAGPQLEYTYDIEAKKTAFGFPVGGHVELAFGTGNSLGLFLGYDTKKATHGPDDTAAVGRLSFVHNF